MPLVIFLSFLQGVEIKMLYRVSFCFLVLSAPLVIFAALSVLRVFFFFLRLRNEQRLRGRVMRGRAGTRRRIFLHCAKTGARHAHNTHQNTHAIKVTPAGRFNTLNCSSRFDYTYSCGYKGPVEVVGSERLCANRIFRLFLRGCVARKVRKSRRLADMRACGFG